MQFQDQLWYIEETLWGTWDWGCQETALNLSDNVEKLSNTNGGDLELEDMNQNDGFRSQDENKDDDDDLCNDIADERCVCDYDDK